MKGITKYQWCLIAIVSVVFALHLFAIINPFRLYIFDEYYYVPAAKCMLNLTVCNPEHPPLAKLAIAGSIAIFGDNGVGWRLPSVIAGTLSIVVIYLIVRRLQNEKTALLASFLLGFESLWFTHSSIAMLDIIAIFFGLTAAYLFLREKYAISGILLGLAVLSKETTILILPVLIVYSWFASKSLPKDRLKSAWKACLKVGLPALIVFIAGLWVYDVSFGAYPTPAQNIMDMLALQGSVEAAEPGGIINPIMWFIGFKPSHYLIFSTKFGDGEKHQIYQYLGQPNWPAILLIWIALPFAFVYARKGSKLDLLNLLFFSLIHAAFFILSFWRVTYPFHMLLIIPSICVLNAKLVSKLPRPVIIAYCAGILVWFIFWFPVRF